MMKNRLTAAFLAAMMSISLCACGNDDPAAEIGSVIEKTAEEVTSEAEETAPAETEAETTEAENKEAESGTSADADELAEVQKVVDAYFKAVKEKDYDTLLDVTDVELLYYLTNGELGTREDYISCLKEQVVTSDSAEGNWDITDPEPADEYIAQYADFFEMMDEMSEGETAFADTFKIDRVYAIRMKTSGSADMSAASDETDSINYDISINGDYNIDIDMPIIHVNGEWKCDPAVSMTMSLLNMFSGLADSLSEAE